MDCVRPTDTERDSDIGDESAASNDEHSEDDIRDNESVDEDHPRRINNSLPSNSMAVDYGGMGTSRSPEQHNSELPLNHHHQFPSNHPLGALGNFMTMSGLHSIPTLHQPHNDVLEKLKMQVRDMKVGLMDQDFQHSNFGPNVIPTPINTAFTIPSTPHGAFNHSPQNLVQPSTHPSPQQNAMGNNQSIHQLPQTSSQSMTNGFPFTVPSTKDVNPASNSSTSSDASNSSQQNNGWSFEEQYKQVRQLYEINDDPKRREFLDDLFSFMQKRGTPINRLPIMAKSVLDLYELYNLVIARGGLVDVINKKLWQEIIKGLHLPSSITSAAFTLRTQYMKYLYPYECDKKSLSTPSELQAAIDGNRREGRRSSYGHFEAAMHNQMQMPQLVRAALPGGIQQMAPLALVTHGNPQVAAAAAHHRLMAPAFGQNLVQHEIEQRMLEYLKIIQSKNDQREPTSPETKTRDALNALEMSRVALWSMYHNNTSPPSSVNASPQEPQREALNLSETPPEISIKREPQTSMELNTTEREDFSQLPSTIIKRGDYQDNETVQSMRNNFYEPQENMNANDEVASAMSITQAIQANHSHDRLLKRPPIKSLDEHKSGLQSPPVKKSLLANDASPKSDKQNEKISSPPANPDAEMSLSSGMQFTLSRKSTNPNGEELVINLQLNGITYEGVLIANPSASTGLADVPNSTVPPPAILNGQSDTKSKPHL